MMGINDLPDSVMQLIARRVSWFPIGTHRRRPLHHPCASSLLCGLALPNTLLSGNAQG